MKTAIKTTLKPVFTTEEQATLAKAKAILVELYAATGQNDSVVLIDRDGSEIFGANIVKNVCVALDKLSSVEVE